MAGSQEATFLPTRADKTLVSTHRDEPQGEPKSLIEGLVASPHKPNNPTRSVPSIHRKPTATTVTTSRLVGVKNVSFGRLKRSSREKKKFRAAAAERFRKNLAKIWQRFRLKTV